MAEEEAAEDVVNNPDHYNTGNIECIDAIEESMSSVAFKGYLKGNCMKYLWRYDYKGKQVQDLQKAGWYLRKLTEMVTEENTLMDQYQQFIHKSRYARWLPEEEQTRDMA